MTKPLKDLIKSIGRVVEPSHPILIPVALAVIALILVNGYKTYQFVDKDPQYCQLCHVVEEAHREWRVSGHRDYVCQSCHSMNLISQNKLLLAYIFTWDHSEIRHEHAREKPWANCSQCHLDVARQGGVGLRKSYGHARHVFMEGLSCRECHDGETHNFYPDEQRCFNCHQDKGVHGLGMESFACLVCHSFGETASPPTKESCITCHKDIPDRGTMSNLECHSCHQPHGDIRPTEAACVACHANQDSIGRHDRHVGISCLKCHHAHTWRVGPELARELCVECHDYRDPMGFIF